MARSVLVLIVSTLAACGTSSATPDMKVPTGPAGGTVMGPADTHCSGDGGMIVQVTDPTQCLFTPDMAGTPADAGMGDNANPYGDTMYNAEADDDDCKYHVKFTVSPVYQNYNATFVVTATRRTDGSPLTGAAASAQVYLSDTHPAPNAPTVTKEGPPGTYTIGPILFDASGRWTVRFHFFENCYDLIDVSPHGHAAFYLDVP